MRIRLNIIFLFFISLLFVHQQVIAQCPVLGSTPIYLVTNTSNAGAGSFRQAITCANLDPAINSIHFSFASGSAPWIISPATALPQITASGLSIDGTQNGYTLGQIQISGSALSGIIAGLEFNSATGGEVKGLVVRNFPDDGIKIVGSSGITIDGNMLSSNGGGPDPGEGLFISAGSQITVTNNFLGTNVTGNTANPNTSDGADVYGSDNITFSGNVASGNSGSGIRVFNSTNVQITDNNLGVNASAGAGLPNAAHGVEIVGAQVTMQNCVVGKNLFDGIYVHETGGNGIIQNCFIGTGTSGTEDFANNGFGVKINNSATGAIEGCKIAYNFTGGIQVGSTSTGVDITGNEMYCDNSIGISLLSGANGNIVKPNITSASTNTISGTSPANAVIEAFEMDNSGCSWGVCEGRNLLGSATANAGGTWSIPVSATLGLSATATASTAGQGTSAFATCFTINAPACTHPDKPALKALYAATDGPNWTNTWDTTTCDVCNWYGIICNGNGRVICIDLDGSVNCGWDISGGGNGLNGTIPNLNLSELRSLNLSFNNLSGSSPNFSMLPELRELFLTSCPLTGSIPNFSSLNNLTKLFFGDTDVSGTMPSFALLPNLRTIVINNNPSLGGNVPNFSNRPLLDEVQMSGNNLTGNIPNIVNCPILHNLELFNNNLSGSIPNFNLPNIQLLYLEGNMLSNTIPNFNLPNLLSLRLNNNQLSGNLPTLTLPSLDFINFSNNNLSGCFPASYTTFCNIIYDFSNNPLLPWEGDFSQFCSGGTQIGAPCDNASTTGPDEIQPDCSCDESCPLYDGALSATTPICNGESTDITFNFSGGTPPYDVVWSGGAPLNNIDDGHTFILSPTTTTTYSISSITDANGCSGTPGAPVTVTVLNLLNVGNVTGPATACQGSTQTYSVPVVPGTTEYDWSVPPGAVITSSAPYSNTINVNWPAGSSSGDVCCSAVNPCGAGAPKCRAVDFVPIPDAPGLIDGPTEVCRSTTQSFSIDPVPDAAGYQWTVPTGATVAIGQGTESIVVSFGPSAQSGNICVRSVAANSCGQSAQTCLPITAVTQPVQPVFTAGANTMPCEGTTATYSVTSQASVNDYQWDTQGAGDIVSGQGTPSVTILWTLSGATTLSVTAASSICGNAVTKNLSITVRPLPEAVANVTGDEVTCTGATAIYTADLVAGATSYTWEIPGMATAVGNTTGSALNLQWNSTGITTFSVRANNTCGTGDPYLVTVVVNNVPAQPGTVTGPATVCAGSQAVFSIAPVADASACNWTVPAGATIISGQGTTTVTVNFTAGASGQVCVAAVNNCGNSPVRCTNVSAGSGSALTVGAINGPASFCPVQNSAYSIGAVAGAQGYQWTVPAGAFIISGQNTTAITVAWNGAAGGQVCAGAVGSCGAGTPSCITVAPLAGTIFSLGADTTLCPGSPLMLSAGTGAAGYLWSTSATTNQINVSISGNYTVTVTTGSGSTCTVTDNISVTFGATAPPPAVTALQQPATTTNVPVNTAITWQPAGGCTGGYFISVGTTPGGTDIVNNFNTGSSNTWQPGGGFPAGTMIYVTITPFNNTGNGPAAQFSFTTQGIVTGACDPEQDSLALVDFYYLTNGPAWNPVTQMNWLVEGMPIYTWNGINANFDGCVTSIDLTDQNINGPLPDLNLPFLMNLYITGSNLQETIPDFSNTPMLERLVLSNNKLGGVIPDFNHIPNLKHLDIDTNLFIGPLPLFNKVKKLEYLDVNVNQIDSIIPDFQLPQLNHLDLNTNRLTGGIPNFSGIPKLVFLGLAENKLTGTIPYFSNLPLLEFIFLSQNRLSGPIPPFNNIPNKDLLGIDLNRLTFDGLAHHVSYPYSDISYAPQDSVFHDTLLIVTAGTNLDFSLDFDENVAGNEYTWFQDGNIQSAQYQSGNNNLKITNLNPALHNGMWWVHVKNQDAPELTLFSRKITLQVQQVACPDITNNGPFCVGEPIVVGVSNFVEFNWDSGPNGIADPNEITSATLADAGTYTYSGECFPTGPFSGSVTVQVIAPPSVTAASNGSNCEGGNIQLNASGTGIANWSWTGPGGFSSPLQNPVLSAVNTSMNGTYTVTATGTGGCTGTATVTVSVDAPPMPAINSAQPICAGNNLMLEETSGTGNSWAWSGPGAYSATGQIITRSNITVAQSGVYTVTVTNTAGCTATMTTSVSVNTAPAVTATAASPVCANGELSLSVNSGAAWSWEGPDGFTAAVQNPTISGLTTGHQGVYTVTVTQSNGCTSTDEINVSVTDIIAEGVEVPDNCLTGLEITVSGTATGPFIYDWQDLPGTSNPMNRNQLANGNYLLTVTDQPSGCTAALEFDIQGTGGLSLGAASVSANCSQSNGSIDLMVNSGTMPFTFLWSNGAATEDIGNLSPGTYTVTVTDALGCTSSTSATVMQNGNLPAGAAVATNESCMASNGSVNLTVTGGTPPFMFLWNNNATTEDLVNVAQGIYTVAITDASGCSSTASATVGQAGIIPVLSSTSIPASCGQSNGSIDLTAVGGVSFIWSNNTTTEDLFSISSGTYTVTVTGSGNCTATLSVTAGQSGNTLAVNVQTANVISCDAANGSITLLVNGGALPYTFDWADLPGSSNPQDRTNLAAGVYTVTITDNNLCNTISVAEILFTGPLPFKSFQAAICQGDTYTFNNTTYQQPGIYFDTLQSATGCDTAVEITLMISDHLLKITSPATAVCQGSVLPIAAEASDCNTCSYLWSNGLTASQIEVTLAGTYFVTLTDVDGCTESASFVLQTNPLPIAGITLPSGNLLDCTTTALTLTGTGGGTYKWSNGLGTATSVTVAQPGVYSLTVTNIEGCTDEANTLIDATWQTLNIARNDSTTLEPDTPVEIDVKANDLIPPGGDFLLNVIQGPNHCAATITADDFIRLNALDNNYGGEDQLTYVICDADCPNSCDTAVLKIQILKSCIAEATRDIPRAITPNDDGANDIFDPLNVFLNGECPVDTERSALYVYGRSGECIFIGAAPYTPWNGKLKKQSLPEGAYFFILKIVTTGNEITIKRAVNLIN